MIMSRPDSACRRRALVRSSMVLMLGVSSMKMGASASLFMAGASRAKSISSRKPVRRRCESMLATDESRRSTSCSLLISRLKMPTTLPSLTAACSAKLSARLVLPMDGRAATRTRSDFWRPVVIVSRSAKPGADAADLTLVLVQVVEPVVGVVEQRLERREAGLHALLADREELRLGPVDDLADVAVLLVAEPGDPTGRADEVPQDALALDDARVVDGVDGRGREVDEARQVGRAADLVQATLALQRLADGDDVDRLAALVELEDRGVDGAVVLAVEVARAGAAPRPR